MKRLLIVLAFLGITGTLSAQPVFQPIPTTEIRKATNRIYVIAGHSVHLNREPDTDYIIPTTIGLQFERFLMKAYPVNRVNYLAMHNYSWVVESSHARYRNNTGIITITDLMVGARLYNTLSTKISWFVTPMIGLSNVYYTLDPVDGKFIEAVLYADVGIRIPDIISRDMRLSVYRSLYLDADENEYLNYPYLGYKLAISL